MTDEPLYKLKNVTKTHRSPSRKVEPSTDVTALAEVSLEIDNGEFLAVVGRSGGGKTSLANMLGLLDMPTTGELLFQGQLPMATGLDSLRRISIGIVFQEFNLQPHFTALENVALGLTIAGFSRRQSLSLAKDWLAKVGLPDRALHRPSELSGGQQQRVAIARAMAKNPAVLIADEPTGNLDSRSRGEILDLMASLNESGTTVVMVTHDQSAAEQFSSRIIELRDGYISRDWRPAKSILV